MAALLFGISHAVQYKRMNEENASADDLDALMDKYDQEENKKNEPPKPAVSKNGVTVTKGEVQDMELKILTGNDLKESSQKAYDDDLYNNAIQKFQTESKEQKNTMILTKENAQEACIDLFQNKDSIDQFDASDKVKKKFNKLWDEHDISKNGYIDTTEAYSLMQDMSRED